jgi:transposase InsO family protein
MVLGPRLERACPASTDTIFEYLEIWHNRRRRHRALGWLRPIGFEDKTPIAGA